MMPADLPSSPSGTVIAERRMGFAALYHPNLLKNGNQSNDY